MASPWTHTAPWKADTCRALFNEHCQHWGLPDDEHALLHAQVRLIQEVAAADEAAGVYSIVGPDTIKTAGSTSSVRDDPRRLLELLADEGGWRLTRA